MLKKRDDEYIIRDFGLRRHRQHLSAVATIFLLLFLALLSKRPDLLGEFPKNTIIIVQFAVIVAFLVFSAYNWRCPSCNKYLGSDINRNRCRHCGTRLRDEK